MFLSFLDRGQFLLRCPVPPHSQHLKFSGLPPPSGRPRTTVKRLFLSQLLGNRRKPSWLAFRLQRYTPASFLRFSGVLFSFAGARSPWSIFDRTEDPEHYKGSSNSVALCREESAVFRQLLL
ncbi:hypothetical protein TNCV_3212361 [Trichonephila clavipes]|nr:hypothetical protein TNCV_3212361 [Trichonephila clavipes]